MNTSLSTAFSEKSLTVEISDHQPSKITTPYSMHSYEAIEKRKLILEITKTLFLKYGYHGTTLHKIAAECQIDKAIIYYYFRDKANLAKSVLKEIAKFYEINLLNISKSSSMLSKRQLGIQFIDQLNMLIETGQIWLLLTYEFDKEDLPFLKETIDKIINQWTATILDLIEFVDNLNFTRQMAALASFELIIAAMHEAKRKAKSPDRLRICLKKLLKSLWLS